jgi:NAD(P)H dehydrogenase (quinone)
VPVSAGSPGSDCASRPKQEEDPMSIYAVTGASGHLGRLAVQQLLARGVLASDIVAVVPSRARVSDFVVRGIHVREADYSEPDSLRHAGELS